MPHNDDYRWPAYMSQKMRQELKIYLAENNLSFSEWVRRHAQADLRHGRGKISRRCRRKPPSLG